MPYESLTKVRLTSALRRLSELATAEGLVLEVALYGGAVFTLARLMVGRLLTALPKKGSAS